MIFFPEAWFTLDDTGITFLTCGLVITYILYAWLLGRVFHKAGVAKWKAWVPFVSTWKYFNIGGHKGTNLFLVLASYVAAILGSYLLYTSPANEAAATVTVGIILVILAVALFIFYTYVVISSTYNIQKKLNKPLPFILLVLIHVGAPLWLWILGLDGSKWVDKKGRPQIK